MRVSTPPRVNASVFVYLTGLGEREPRSGGKFKRSAQAGRCYLEKEKATPTGSLPYPQVQHSRYQGTGRQQARTTKI